MTSPSEIPLVVATLNDDTEMIITLLSGGAFVDYRLESKQNHMSALHVAASKAKIAAFKVGYI